MTNIDKYGNGEYKAKRLREQDGRYTVAIYKRGDPVFSVSDLRGPESMQVLRRIDSLEYKPKRA